MVSPFLTADIEPFLELAGEEGWICGRWELEFLLRSFPAGCLVCREAGRAVAFVTSVAYGKSGWVGNLLVHPESRKRGLGRRLMEHSLAELAKSEVETTWLTASAEGAGLYRQLGFRSVDTVRRWVGSGRSTPMAEPVAIAFDVLGELDGIGWGDRRDALLRVTCGRGRLYRSADGFLCCQPWDGAVQIGPWGSLTGEHAGALFAAALAGAGERVFLDVPAGNRAAEALLTEHGFTVQGSNLLMYLGVAPEYRPENVYALASMGSMG